MRRALLAGVAFAALAASSAAHAQSLDLSGYQLTFDSEFGSGISAGTSGTRGVAWETSVSYGSLSTGNLGQVNPTPPGQSGSQYSINGCALQMAVNGNSSPYLDTNPSGVPGGFSQQYGYFEASLKQAPGMWNAFWLMPNSGPWPPEIDVLEGDGTDAEFTNHGGDINTPVNNTNIYNRPDLSTGFHTYGLMWTPTTLTWYLDGQAVFSAPTASNERQAMNVILSAYDKDNAGGSGSQDVQWVHVYSNDGANPAIQGQPGYTNHDGSTSVGGNQPGGCSGTTVPTAKAPPPPTTAAAAASELKRAIAAAGPDFSYQPPSQSAGSSYAAFSKPAPEVPEAIAPTSGLSASTTITVIDKNRAQSSVAIITSGTSGVDGDLVQQSVDNGMDTVTYSPDVAASDVVLGPGTQTFMFLDPPRNLTVTGGSGTASVTANSGSGGATFIVGTGALDVIGGWNATYIVHADSGDLTVEDFGVSSGDRIEADVSLLGSYRAKGDGFGGIIITLGGSKIHLVGQPALASSQIGVYQDTRQSAQSIPGRL